MADETPKPWRMPTWMQPFTPLFRDMELRPATVESIEAAVNLRGSFDSGDRRMAERQRLVWQLRFLVRLYNAEQQRRAKPTKESTP
jgi:hypothetical protein